ncbi:MAG: diphthine--ammonia ligase [Candidatus Bathyarchaeota archaeon]|nr:diphthine--ammonia ligase [Candidatus Bathyarchaeota archaeon]
MKVVAAWSGGKDSCLAYHKAVKQGFEVVGLITFMQNEKASNFHAIRSDLLDAQAKALGLPITKNVTNPGTYEQQFKDALKECKAKGAVGLVTGDIYEVAGHEEGWLERVCGEVGLEPVRPLWMGDTKRIFQEFTTEGFKATVVRTNMSMLGEEWLGRELDQKFLADVLALGNVDPCGEGGEYHTVVTDGPAFSSAIKLVETQKSSRNGFGRLEILRFEVEPKKQDA